MKKIWRNKKGFTLIEIVLSIGIMGVLAIALIGSNTLSQRINEKGVKIQEISLGAENLIQYYKGKDYYSLYEEGAYENFYYKIIQVEYESLTAEEKELRNHGLIKVIVKLRENKMENKEYIFTYYFFDRNYLKLSI